MPEQKVLVCTRVTDLRYVVPGSVQTTCSDCSQFVWISPSSWEILAGSPAMDIVCNRCALVRTKREGGEIAEISPAQMREIAEYRRRQ